LRCGVPFFFSSSGAKCSSSLFLSTLYPCGWRRSAFLWWVRHSRWLSFSPFIIPFRYFQFVKLCHTASFLLLVKRRQRLPRSSPPSPPYFTVRQRFVLPFSKSRTRLTPCGVLPLLFALNQHRKTLTVPPRSGSRQHAEPALHPSAFLPNNKKSYRISFLSLLTEKRTLTPLFSCFFPFFFCLPSLSEEECRSPLPPFLFSVNKTRPGSPSFSPQRSRKATCSLPFSKR